MLRRKEASHEHGYLPGDRLPEALRRGGDEQAESRRPLSHPVDLSPGRTAGGGHQLDAGARHSLRPNQRPRAGEPRLLRRRRTQGLRPLLHRRQAGGWPSYLAGDIRLDHGTGTEMEGEEKRNDLNCF